MSLVPSLLNMTLSNSNIELSMELGGEYNVNLDSSGYGTLWIELLNNNLISLDETSFPSNLRIIKENLFSNNTNLTTVNLPFIEEIGNTTFYNCGILNINMPSLTNAGSRSFGNNPFVEVSLPSLEYVSSQMFYNCTELKKADFLSINRIALQAFRGCTSLDCLVLRNENEIVELGNINSLEETAIENGTGYIYVPQNMLQDYSSYGNWVSFSSQFRSINELPEPV